MLDGKLGRKQSSFLSSSQSSNTGGSVTHSAIHDGSDFKGFSPGQIDGIICVLYSSFLCMPRLPNQIFQKSLIAVSVQRRRDSPLFVGRVLALRDL